MYICTCNICLYKNNWDFSEFFFVKRAKIWRYIPCELDWALVINDMLISAM